MKIAQQKKKKKKKKRKEKKQVWRTVDTLHNFFPLHWSSCSDSAIKLCKADSCHLHSKRLFKNNSNTAIPYLIKVIFQHQISYLFSFLPFFLSFSFQNFFSSLFGSEMHCRGRKPMTKGWIAKSDNSDMGWACRHCHLPSQRWPQCQQGRE